jgi:hypothetical protein
MYMCHGLYKEPGVHPTKLFFFVFFFFGIKLGHFNINIFFLYVTKMQAYQLKTEKFFVSKKSLAKKKSLVGSTPGLGTGQSAARGKEFST